MRNLKAIVVMTLIFLLCSALEAKEQVKDICKVCSCANAKVDCWSKLKGKELHIDAFQNIPDRTESINLKDNDLVELPFGLFRGQKTRSVMTLNLSFNQLATIPDYMFTQLSELTTLNLEKNKLITLQNYVFTGLTKLKELNLAMNKLTKDSFKDQVLKPLKKLTLLNVAGNYLEKLPPSIQELTDTLEELVAYFCHLNTVSPYMLSKFKQIKKLDFTANRLPEFDGKLFVEFPYLKYIGLAKNRLKSIPKNIKLATNLITITLADNPGFVCLPNKLPRGLSSDIDICFNFIDESIVANFANQKVEESDIKAISNSVMVLSLRNCQISYLRPGTFDHLTELEDLDLSFNKIPNLPEGLFKHNKKLVRLYLDYNSIQSLPANIFNVLPNLHFLTLAGNKFNVRTIEKPEALLKGLKNLSVLKLDFNNLNGIPRNFFDGLTNLETLRLFKCEITTLPEGIFNSMRRLKSLDLSENHIAKIPEGTFSKMENIQKITLIFNRLTTLEVKNKFSNLSKLTELILTPNPAITCVEVNNHNAKLFPSVPFCKISYDSKNPKVVVSNTGMLKTGAQYYTFVLIAMILTLI